MFSIPNSFLYRFGYGFTLGRYLQFVGEDIVGRLLHKMPQFFV